ncbi:hypothetical protein ACFWAY_22155 [Rhodococcus sp. NPDC059968]|uniref:hypothetical protein n=1 Tax=Rhodococcus sp. NPDC059968 TaxID=3347017 RepID=UPI00366F34B2
MKEGFTMHTADQLHASMFSVDLDGRPATINDLFPNWGPADRFGIVVDEPFGGVGASILIQAAITAFFDCVPVRRTEFAQYPEIYLFSVGGSQGDHSMFDFWPPRKDVRVARDPVALLEAINDRAITRLAVPEGMPLHVEYAERMAAGWSETNSAIERVQSVFVYAPSGAVAQPDVVLRATSPELESNGARTLDPQTTLSLANSMSDEDFEKLGPHAKSDAVRFVESVNGRSNDFSAEVRASVAARRREIVQDGIATETYRRISVEQALALLVPTS